MLLASASTANAQATNVTYRGAGLLVSGGGGLGSAGASCDACSGGRTSGPAFTARLGGMLNPYLAFAGQIDYLRKSEDGVRSTTRNLTFAAIAYPSQRSGFYLSGHIGQGMRTDVSSALIGDPGFEPFKASSLAIGGGIGYDFGVSSALAVTPYLTAMTNVTESERAGIKPNMIQVGVALTWHGR